MMKPKPEKKQPNLLLHYAGLGTQIFVALGLGLYAGKELDECLEFSNPVLIWVLPLFIILSMLIKIIIDTSKKNK